jgi:hypothetical protein
MLGLGKPGKQLQKQPNVKDTIWFLYFIPPMLVDTIPAKSTITSIIAIIATATTDKHPLQLRYHFRVSLSTHPLKYLKAKQPF